MNIPRVLVIVPAHNEQDSLPLTLAEVRAKAPGIDLLIVDDGSHDDTSRVAREAGVPVVRHPVNLGVGGALQTGFRWAYEHGYDIGVQLDADGQHDPAYLTSVVEPVAAGRCDVCIGSRFVAATGYRAPWNRKLGMLLFSGVVRLALGRTIADTTSGFRAYNRAVMRVCQFDFPRVRTIADETGALVMTDMAHVAGLVAAGAHDSPVPHSDFVTTTTHKTLRGPRGGMVLCRAAFAKDGADASPSASPEAFRHVLAKEVEDWRKIVRLPWFFEALR